MDLRCLVDGHEYQLTGDEVARSALLLRHASARTRMLTIPVPLPDLQLWQHFRRLEDPCPAALAIVIQVRLAEQLRRSACP